MQKDEIINLLETKHVDLFNWLDKQSNDNWEKGPEGKWTTGQHVLHLTESLQLLNKALSYPNFLLKYKFGNCNRDIRDYNTVVKNYQTKLIKNQEKASVFNQNLEIPQEKDRQVLLNKLETQNKKLQKNTSKWKDKNLDSLLIPHPLMGRMTVREIIMWTAHHTEHHTDVLKNKY